MKLIKQSISLMLLLTTLFFFNGCEDAANFKIYEYPDFTIESFSPMAARPGTQVTINGSDFGELKGAVTVYFNGVATTQTEIVSVSDDQIIVTVPENASSGKITVKVWKNTKEFEDTFEFIPGAVISTIDKVRGQAGDIVTITGENFGVNIDDVHIYVGEAEVEISSVSDTEIKFVIPDAESGDIVLNIGGQEIKSSFLLIGDAQITGTLIGHTGSWGNDPATTIAAAVDGNINTFIDGPTATGYVGYDVGADKQASLTSVRYVPRTSHPQRMVGGEIRGANDPTLIDAVTLYTITEQPATGVYTNVNISTNQNFRYIYYYSANGNCNIAEIEFYGNVINAVIPEGKYIFEFNDPTATGDWMGAQNATNLISNGKLKVTFDPVQFTGTNKRRSDLYYSIGGQFPQGGSPKADWIVTPEYPIMAFRITFTGTGLAKPGTGNMKLDPYTGSNNSYQTDLMAKNIIYYDVSDKYTARTALNTWQLKIADITSVEETGYEVDWIRTFKSKAELDAFIAYMKY